MNYGYGSDFYARQLAILKAASDKAKKAKGQGKSGSTNLQQWYKSGAKSWRFKPVPGAFPGGLTKSKNAWWFEQLEKKPLSWLARERRNLEADIKSLPVKTGYLFWASSKSYPTNPSDSLVALMKVQSRRKNEEELANADKAAQKQGYQSAADMLATKDVEKEWYNKKYGATSPAEIEAYKAMEKEKFGRTSFEQAMSGEHDPQFLGQETDGLAVEAQKAQLQEELEAQAQALQAQKQAEEQAAIIAEKQRKKQQNIMLIGGAIGIGLVAFFALRK
tara:strand:+ start:195 stop:1022 length:828 start_codon:yes stop_codon:yes gene_type:complete